MTDTLAQYRVALLGRWRWVAWGVLLATTVALVLKPPMYQSEATVFVRTPGDVSRVQDGGDLFARARAGTYAALANSASVSSRVVANLGLAMTPDDLSRRIQASNRRDTALLDISVSAPSADESHRFTSVLVPELEAAVRSLQTMPGSLVPRAEFVFVDPPSEPELLLLGGTAVSAVLVSVAFAGGVLGAVGAGAVLRSMLAGQGVLDSTMNTYQAAGLWAVEGEHSARPVNHARSVPQDPKSEPSADGLGSGGRH